MNTIYKYVILDAVGVHDELTLPIGSKLLSVESQGMTVVLYAQIDTERKSTEQYELFMYGTGHLVHHYRTAKFLGTAKMNDGALMWHVFYKRKIWGELNGKVKN